MNRFDKYVADELESVLKKLASLAVLQDQKYVDHINRAQAELRDAKARLITIANAQEGEKS